MKVSVGSFGRFVRRADCLTMKHTNDAKSCRSEMSAEETVRPIYIFVVLATRQVGSSGGRFRFEALQHPLDEELRFSNKPV
jgi:hypothetical protein